MQTPRAFCESITLKSKSSFLFAAFCLSAEKKRAFSALYAFCRTIDDWADGEKNPEIARQNLRHARQIIERFPCLDESLPIFYELSWATQRFQLNPTYFFALLDGMLMDLTAQRYADFPALEKYCFNVASAVGLLLVPIFGQSSRCANQYAYDLGMALQLTNILRDLKEDAQRQRVYVPEECLRATQISVAQFLKIETLPLATLKQIGAPLIQKARYFYESAQHHFQQLPEKDQKNQCLGLMMGAVYYALFQKIEKNFPATVEKRLALNPFTKFCVALRTYCLRKLW